MMRSLPSGLLIFLVSANIGCSSSAVPAVDREAASKAFYEGVEAFEKKDFQAARDQLTVAVDSHVLNADRLVAALISLAIADAALGDFDKAHESLDRAAKGAPPLDRLHAARSYVFEKQGKKREAKAAWDKARRYNRRVKKYED